MRSPKVSKDFKDILRILSRRRVRYLVVGDHAVMRYTEPRPTKELDIWIDRSPQNTKRLFQALAKFGAPLKNLTPKHFESRYQIFQIGVAPVRIDIIGHIAGLRFSTAWQNRKRTKVNGMIVPFISKSDLIKSKRAAGRTRDLADLDDLQGLT